jgi:hypothetical protein
VSDLATVDLPAVEILAAGQRIRGIGSPAEGDLYTPADLRAMAEATRELGDEWRAPAKIGHGSDQPAVGWLDEVRVEGSKLLADIRSVPVKFAELVKARAYRSRSVELSKVTSQRTGKTYDLVPTGLAWLGAKLPAVRTLDDVVAMYADDGVQLQRMYETASQVDVDAELDTAIRQGRISPQERDYFEGFRNAEFRRAAIATRPQTVFGPGTTMTLDEQHEHSLAAQLGVKVEELI